MKAGGNDNYSRSSVVVFPANKFAAAPTVVFSSHTTSQREVAVPFDIMFLSTVNHRGVISLTVVLYGSLI